MDKCPCCERGFWRINDFPIVLVVRVDRLEFPEFVEGRRGERSIKIEESEKILPKKVLKLFKEQRPRRARFGGMIYTAHADGYEVHEDLTDEYKRAAESAPVEKYLSTLESLAGQETETRNVLPKFELVKFDQHVGSFYRVPNTDALLDVRKDVKTDADGWINGTAKCTIALFDDAHFAYSVDMARLVYEGKLIGAPVSVFP